MISVMRTRIPLAFLLAMLLTLLAASSAQARLTTKLMIGKDAGLGGLGLGFGQLVEPADAAVGPNGDIYVAESQDCTVRVFNAAGAPLRQFGSCPTSNFQSNGSELLTGPTAISVDAKSRVYISSYAGLVITDSDGNVLGRLGNAFSDPFPVGPVGTAVADPDPADPDGATELFIADSFYSRVYKLEVGYSDNAIGFGWIAGVDVVSGNAETGFEVCTDFASCKGGAGPADWSSMRDVSIASPAGPVFVLTGNRFVKKLDPQSGQEAGSGFQLATYPTYNTIAARSDGGFYASPLGTDTGYIASFDSDGNQLSSLGSVGSPSAAADGFGTPYSVTSADGGTRFAIGDAGMHRAGVYDSATGANVRFVGKHDGIGWQHGSGSDGFAGVSDVVPDGAGGYWILDRGNHRVVRYSGDGTQVYSTIDLTTIGLQGRISQYGPQGMGISSDGSQLYVADSWNHRVIRFDVNVAGHTWSFNSMVGNDVDSSNGASAVGEVCTTESVCQGGLSGTDGRSFNFPVDIAVVPDSTYPVNNVWIVEQNNNRVVRMDQNFNLGGSFGKNSGAGGSGSAGTLDGEFSSPQAIAFESDGSFWVSDVSGRLQKFDAAGAFVKKFFPAQLIGGSNYGVQTLSGLAIDGSNIYVTESSLHRVAVYSTSTTNILGGVLPDSSFGAIGSNAGQFFQPRGISVSGGDFIVADDGNSRVQVIGEDAAAGAAGTITFNSPVSGDKIYNKTGVPLDFTAVDPDGEALTCTPAPGTIVALSVGMNDPSVSCDDPLNDPAVDGDVEVERIDDLDAPTLMIGGQVSPVKVTAAQSLTVDAADAVAGLASVTCRTNGAAATPCDGGSYTTPTLLSGVNTVTVVATDLAGNANTQTVEITVDQAAPTVTITSPAAGTTTATGSAILSFTATDAFDPAPPVCDRVSGTSIPLTVGANTIAVSCTDWVGNVGTTSVSFTYAPVPPVPHVTIKFPKKLKFKGTIRATVTCDMACPLVLTVAAKIGKKRYSAKAKATLSSAGRRVLKVKFKKSATRAIRKSRKLPKLRYKLTYGAKSGKSGTVKASK